MNSPLWTIDAMASAMDAKIEGSPVGGVSGLSIDTRTLTPGEAYFAIKGDVHDGHAFVAAAHKGGAAVSVVSRQWLERLEGETGPLLVVDDVLAALEKLGAAARSRTDAKIVAVTGSVGKTSTKEALRLALSADGTVHAAVASFNNHWGVPLTLARMPQKTDYGVIEIGMNHSGEITPLVKLTQPDVAVITNVAAVHLGAFDSVDDIARAKAEIFDGLKPEGAALLNGDDERIALLSTLAREAGVERIFTFGESSGSDVLMKKLNLQQDCSCLSVDVMGDAMMLKVGAPGRHLAINALAVLGVAKLLDADLTKCGLALAKLTAVKGRGERHLLAGPQGRMTLIDESYNANPASMRAALDLLGAAAPERRGRRIAVLGDMLELGPSSPNLHADLASSVLENGIDRVLLGGAQMKSLHHALAGQVDCIHSADADGLVGSLRDNLIDGDVVMIKASLGMGFGALVANLLKTFPSESEN